MASVKVQMILLLLYGTIGVARAGYNYDFLAENCTTYDNFTRDLASSPATYGFVRPVRHGGYPRGMDCTLTIYAPKHHYLVVKFRRLETYQPTSKCDEDYMTIAGNTSTYRYCGYRTPGHSLVSTANFLQVRFVSNAVIDGNTRIGFEIYYTAFHKGECMTGGDNPEEFRCRAKRCIPSELKCDRLDNCGDWSDERAGTCGLSTPMTICVSIVGALVAGTCCIAIFMCICAKKKERSAQSRRDREVVQVEYTPGGNNPPPYGSANAGLGEKPPLPECDNYAYAPGPATVLSPQQFLAPPPAYDSIDSGHARNQVAPEVATSVTPSAAAAGPDVGRNQVAPAVAATPSSTVPAFGAPVTSHQETARHEQTGEYEDVDLQNGEQYDVVDLRDDDAKAASAHGNDVTV